MAKSASSASKSFNEMPFLVTQERRLQRLPGAATADGPNFEWQMAGLLALRAYEQGLEFELFSNVEAARPCDDLVLRLLGPAHLLPSPFMFFIKLKHSRPGARNKTVTEQAFTSGSGDFNLRKYMYWFTNLREEHNNQAFSDLLLNTPLENVRLYIYTTKDAFPYIRERKKGGQGAPQKPFPFEDIFYTNDRRAEDALSFDSSCPKVWELFDQDERKDLYQNEFLPSLKVFCNQASSRDMNNVIEEQMYKVFGKKAKTFLRPFLESLEEWSENNKNNYCLSNNILTYFFGQELPTKTLQSCCEDVDFKRRLQRWPGTGIADGYNFEWQMAGLLALRAYEQGLEFELFSNVEAARPCHSIVLRLLGPARLLPSPFMYFIQLKHSRPGVKNCSLTEKAFMYSWDFSLPWYMEWFTKLREEHKTKEFSDLLLNTPLENVRLSIYTTEDAVPDIRQRQRDGQAAPQKPFPFEDLFYTNDKGADDVFSFDSSCTKVWHLFDEEDRKYLYQKEFLPSFKVFCNQASSRDMNKVIEEQMYKVFGKKAKTFLQPFLESLREWSGNNKNNYCLSNNILTDFFGQELRKTTLQSCCEDLDFQSVNDLGATLRTALRNATSLLCVTVNEAKEPGLRAAKVLQAVRAEFGDEAWLYVDGSTLKDFNRKALIAAAKRVKVLVSDVERTEDVDLLQILLASIGRGVLQVTLKKTTESDFNDVWTLQELSEKTQEETNSLPGSSVKE